MEAFYAAMRDAAAWFNDPANFEELVKIYTPLISFGDLPGADELRRNWIKSVIPAYSKDLTVKRASVKAIIDFYTEDKSSISRSTSEDRLGQGARRLDAGSGERPSQNTAMNAR